MVNDNVLLLGGAAAVGVGLWWLFQKRPAGRPTLPVRKQAGDLERIRNFYEEDLERLGREASLTGSTSDEIYQQYRKAHLEYVRDFYSEDLRRFGFLGKVAGFDTESIYANYLELYYLYTGQAQQYF